MLISRRRRARTRGAIAAITVVAGGGFAVSVGHHAALAALGSLSSASAQVSALASSAPRIPLTGGGSSTAPAALPAAGPSTSHAAASAIPVPSPAQTGLTSEQLQQLSERVRPVMTRLSALASRHEVAQVCAALEQGGAREAALRAQVRARLPRQDQVISDAQLDSLLTEVDASLC